MWCTLTLFLRCSVREYESLLNSICKHGATTSVHEPGISSVKALPYGSLSLNLYITVINCTQGTLQAFLAYLVYAFTWIGLASLAKTGSELGNLLIFFFTWLKQSPCLSDMFSVDCINSTIDFLRQWQDVCMSFCWPGYTIIHLLLTCKFLCLFFMIVFLMQCFFFFWCMVLVWVYRIDQCGRT